MNGPTIGPVIRDTYWELKFVCMFITNYNRYMGTKLASINKQTLYFEYSPMLVVIYYPGMVILYGCMLVKMVKRKIGAFNN